jgi:hypothetical protein
VKSSPRRPRTGIRSMSSSVPTGLIPSVPTLEPAVAAHRMFSILETLRSVKELLEEVEKLRNVRSQRQFRELWLRKIALVVLFMALALRVTKVTAELSRVQGARAQPFRTTGVVIAGDARTSATTAPAKGEAVAEVMAVDELLTENRAGTAGAGNAMGNAKAKPEEKDTEEK